MQISHRRIYDWREQKKRNNMVLQQRLSAPGVKEQILSDKKNNILNNIDRKLKSYNKIYLNKDNPLSLDRLNTNYILDLMQKINKSVKESEFTKYAERFLDIACSTLLEHQYYFMNNNASITIMELPRGKGKSFANSVFAVSRCLMEPNIHGFVVNGTEKQVKDVNFISNTKGLKGGSVEDVIYKFIGQSGYDGIVSIRKCQSGEMYIIFNNGSKISFVSASSGGKEGDHFRGDNADFVIFDEFWYYADILPDLLGASMPTVRDIKIGAPLRAILTSTIHKNANSIEYENAYPNMVKQGVKYMFDVIRKKVKESNGDLITADEIVWEFKENGRSKKFDDLLGMDGNEWLSQQRIFDMAEYPPIVFGPHNNIVYNYIDDVNKDGNRYVNDGALTQETELFAMAAMPNEQYKLEKLNETPDRQDYELWTPALLDKCQLDIDMAFKSHVLELARDPVIHIMLAVDPSGTTKVEKASQGKCAMGALLVAINTQSRKLFVLKDYTVKFADPVSAITHIVQEMEDDGLFDMVKGFDGIDRNIVSTVAIEYYGEAAIVQTALKNYADYTVRKALEDNIVMIGHKPIKNVKPELAKSKSGKVTRINNMWYFYNTGIIRHCNYNDESMKFNLKSLERTMLSWSRDEKVKKNKIEHLEYTIDNLDALTVAISFTQSAQAKKIRGMHNMFELAKTDRIGNVI